MESIGKKLVHRYAERMGHKSGSKSNRPDLLLCDWEKTGRDSAKLLVAWAKGLATPELEAVDNFVLASFEGKVKSHLNTARLYPGENVLTLIVSTFLPTRRISDSADMARISPNRFLEVKAESASKNVWEVRQDENGDRHLVMLQADNLEELLVERRKAIKYRKASVPTLSRLPESAQVIAEVGDRVRFYKDGLMLEGKVTAFTDQVAIKTQQGVRKVAASAIVDVVQKDPATLDDQKMRQREYWRSILGDDYVARWLGEE